MVRWWRGMSRGDREVDSAATNTIYIDTVNHLVTSQI